MYKYKKSYHTKKKYHNTVHTKIVQQNDLNISVLLWIWKTQHKVLHCITAENLCLGTLCFPSHSSQLHLQSP